MPTLGKFGQIAARLEEATYSLHYAAHLPEPLSSATEEVWRREDLRVQDALDAIARRYAKGSEAFRDLPPIDEYFLSLRFRTAASFLHQCDMPEDNTMIPYPKATDPEMIEWMLVDWWHQVGRDAALYEYQHSFQKD